MGIGTQFLAIPASAYDLIYFNSPWRNPATLSHLNKVPELGLAYGNWLAGIETVGFKFDGNELKLFSGVQTAIRARFYLIYQNNYLHKILFS